MVTRSFLDLLRGGEKSQKRLTYRVKDDRSALSEPPTPLLIVHQGSTYIVGMEEPAVKYTHKKGRESMSESPYHDPIIMLMEDDLVHTDEYPFCDDPTCGCHESPDLIAQVAHDVADGLLTPQEATHFVAGLLM